MKKLLFFQCNMHSYIAISVSKIRETYQYIMAIHCASPGGSNQLKIHLYILIYFVFY